MKDEKSSIDSLIKGGILGAALGAILSKDKEEGAVVGAILGAIVSATIDANEKAKKTNLSMYVEEDGSLYEVSPDGSRRFVKRIRIATRNIPDSFKLD